MLVLPAVSGIGYYFNHCLSMSSSRARAESPYVLLFTPSCIHLTNTY